MLYGREYPTAEHAFQAFKATNPKERENIRTTSRPGQAKRLGRQIELRSDWEDIKIGVMSRVLKAKFADPELQAWLIATGDAHLEEGNTWGDRYWGTVDGTGKNHLGNILMKLRKEAQ